MVDYYIEMKLLRRFAIGTAIHEHDEKPFNGQEYTLNYVYDGRPDVPSFHIIGHEDISDGRIYDIKTCQTFVGMPKLLHLMQINDYQTFHYAQTGVRMEASMWYVNLKDCDDMIIPVTFKDTFAICINLCLEAHLYLCKKNKKITWHYTDSCESYCPIYEYCKIFRKMYNEGL